MASKKPKKTDTQKTDLDLDMDDLADLGDDMNFGDELGADDDNRNPTRAKVMTDLARDAGQGALESSIRVAANKALPEAYSANYTEALDIANFTSEVVDRNKQALNKSAYRLGKEVRKILPFKVGLLDKYLQSQESKFESFKSQTEEQLREAGIASETASIFEKQLDVQKSLYARTEAQNEIDGRERLIQSKLSQDVLANMDGNIAHQTAFMTQISKEYYKRSLELQFKSYYVQADSLRTMRDYYKAFTIQFTNIEKNTSLPDFVKLRNTEALQELMRTQMVQSVYGNLAGNNKYLASMKKKMSGFVNEKVDNVTNAMDGVSDMVGMMNSGAEGGGGSALGMLASAGASMGGSALGERLGERISPALREKIKNNKAINAGANRMAMLGASPSSLLESMKERVNKGKDENADEATAGRWVMSKLFGGAKTFLDAGTPEGAEYEVTQSGYLSHNNPAIFDNKVHRSITEVIPLYLARILQSSSDMVSMYGSVHPGAQGGSKLMTYDYEGRALSTEDAIATNIKAKVLKEKSVANRAGDLSKTILNDVGGQAGRTITDKKELTKLKVQLGTKQSSTKLAGYIERASEVVGENMDFDTLFKNYEDNALLKNLVEEDPALKELVDKIKLHAPTATTTVDARMKDLTKNYPLEGIKHLFKTVSAMAGAPTPNLLGNKPAESLSRAFVNYILKSGKDVTPPSVVQRSCFVYLLADDATDALMHQIASFVYQVKRIIATQDIQLVSGMELSFALMNKSLREDRDIEPSVFQNLAELYPSIVGTGRLDATNIREGNLRAGGTDRYVDNALLVQAGNRPDDQAPEPEGPERGPLPDNLIDRTLNAGREQAQKLKQRGREFRENPEAAATKLIEDLKSSATSVTNRLKERTTQIGMQMADFNAIHSKSLTALKTKGFEIAIERYDKFISKMQLVVDDMKQEQLERAAAIANTQSNMRALTGDPEANEQVSRLTQAYQASSQRSIELLEVTIRILKTQREDMIALNKLEIPDVKEKVKQMKAALTKSRDAIRAAVLTYRQAGRDVFNT